MDNVVDKSHSDSENMTSCEQDYSPPSKYVATRSKRKGVRRDFEHEFSIFKEEIKNMISSLMAGQEKELRNNSTTLKQIQQTSQNIESSIAFLTSQQEEFKKTISHLEGELKENRKCITRLEEKLEYLQLDSRKTNLELKNVPKKPNETKEDLVDMVLHLSKNIGSQLVKGDIRDIYRVKGKNKDITKNTPIIVETTSTLIKTEVLKLCKVFNVKQKSKLCAKHLGFRVHEDTPIFVTEQLTPRAARLYFLARDLIKTKSFKYCWTAYGRVYVRKADNSPIIAIKNDAQIQELLNNT